jgi:hypothetical protein
MDNYRTIQARLRDRIPFKGNSMWADFEEYEGETWYTVYSYRTPIARQALATWHYQLNPEKYSTTTSRHQNLIRRAWGIA